MSDHTNNDQPDISLGEVFGQELEEYLYSAQAQNNIVDHNLYGGEQTSRQRGFKTPFSHENDPFFDNFSSEELGMDEEDLFGMSVLIPSEEYHKVKELV